MVQHSVYLCYAEVNLIFAIHSEGIASLEYFVSEPLSVYSYYCYYYDNNNNLITILITINHLFDK